jgi:UDP-hydrolysing UDP-N-acetyl-D-glucosamine 2-epimerase
VTGVRSLAVLTGTRAEYGLLRWVIRAVRDDVDVSVIATGAHLAAEHGHTIDAIRADGVDPVIVPSLVDATALGTARSMARVVDGVGAALADGRADLLLVLGDRSETFAGAAAASALRLPIAHIHGGEITSGAQDDAWRHAITKLAHVHLAATPLAAARIARMGEEPWRVHVVGSLGVEQVRHAADASDGHDLVRSLALEEPIALVTFHPTTLGGDPEHEVGELVAALAGWNGSVVVTAPNADIGSDLVRAPLERFVAVDPARRRFVASLGSDAYVALMRVAAVMIGNSSSGIIEAPAIPLAVVNVGARQEGRERAGNVVDVPAERGAITAGIRRATEPSFTESLRRIASPYGDGRASERIATVLRTLELGERLLRKRFVDAG